MSMLRSGGHERTVAATIVDRWGARRISRTHDERRKNGGVRHGGTSGATFRAGQQVNHTANGFHPTALLRDFDYGTTSELPDGRTLREWEIFAADEEIEVAPG
eukprot:gene27255-32845_t